MIARSRSAVVELCGRHGILHLELQSKVEADVGERVAEYVMRLWRREHVPIRSVVVFLREARTAPASPFVIPWGPEETLTCRFETVRLWELPQERVLGTPHYGLWPLASLMAGVTVESTQAVAERILQAPLPDEERRELVVQLSEEESYAGRPLGEHPPRRDAPRAG